MVVRYRIGPAVSCLFWLYHALKLLSGQGWHSESEPCPGPVSLHQNTRRSSELQDWTNCPRITRGDSVRYADAYNREGGFCFTIKPVILLVLHFILFCRYPLIAYCWLPRCRLPTNILAIFTRKTNPLSQATGYVMMTLMSNLLPTSWLFWPV